jgi:hypothetical protein
VTSAAAAEAFANLVAVMAAELAAKIIEERSRSQGSRYATAKHNPMGSPRRFRDAARAGKFPARQVGREIMAKWEDVEAYIESMPVPASRLKSRAELTAELDAAMKRPGRSRRA